MKIIFDFDGTLVKSEWYVKQVLGDYLTDKNVEIFNKFGFKGLLERKVLSLIELLSLLRKGRNEWLNNLDKILAVPGIEKVLKGLIKNNISLGLLSSNKRKNIDGFFKKENWNYFEFIYTGMNIFGKDKVIEKMMEKHKFKKSEVIYVGDEKRDVVACKIVGIKMIGVTWGYNNKEALWGVDYLVDSPTELLNLLLRLSQ